MTKSLPPKKVLQNAALMSPAPIIQDGLHAVSVAIARRIDMSTFCELKSSSPSGLCWKLPQATMPAFGTPEASLSGFAWGLPWAALA